MDPQAGGTSDDFYTFLETVHPDGHRDEGGLGGLPLCPGSRSSSRSTSPPGAVVFATEPIPFAVREPTMDLDAAGGLGQGWRCG